MFDLLCDDLERDVVGDRVGVLGQLHELLVHADGALFARDVLLKDLLHERIGRRFVFAVGELKPVGRRQIRNAAELDNPGGEQFGVRHFFGGMQNQFATDGIFHRT